LGLLELIAQWGVAIADTKAGAIRIQGAAAKTYPQSIWHRQRLVISEGRGLGQKVPNSASGTASGWSFSRSGGWDKKFQTAHLAPPAAGHFRGAGAGTKSSKQRLWHRQRLDIFEDSPAGP